MSYKEIDPEQARRMMESDPEVLLLDVREPHEYEQAHVEGVRLIPLGELPERHQELDPEQTILCICAGGVRSEKAARFLLSQNFKDVTNVTEGMKGWLKRGLPST